MDENIGKEMYVTSTDTTVKNEVLLAESMEDSRGFMDFGYPIEALKKIK